MKVYIVCWKSQNAKEMYRAQETRIDFLRRYDGSLTAPIYQWHDAGHGVGFNKTVQIRG
jgi:hypothetical protein